MGKYFFIFLFSALIQNSLAVVCRLPYTFAYRDSCYYLGSNPELTFNEARIQCIIDGGHLVILETKDEEDFIGNYLHTHHRDSHFFIDATDFRQEGHFYWEHTGRNLTYTNWDRYEPNGWGNEDCVWKFSTSRGWIDISCYDPAAYMCEKEGR